LADETDSRLSDDRREENSDEISILDLLLVIAAGKKLIITLTLVCGIAAGVIAFLTPKSYTATATILPPQQSSSASALIGQLGGLAGLAGQSLGIKNTASAYIGILESRTIADEMIKQFELLELYEKENLSGARKKLKDASDFQSASSGMINISVTDIDPQRAADMANAYVELLKARNNELAVTEASQRRVFFEKQWEEAKNNLGEAEWGLKSFQEQRGVLKVDSQMEAVIQQMARLQAEITAAESELARLKTGATKQNPRVQQQEAGINELRARLRELETQNTGRNQNDPFLPTAMMPEAGLEYARKLRDVKFHEALYEMMARQYEAARLDEANESPLIQVIDDAVPPETKSAPKRSLYILAGLLFGGMMGVFIVFLRHAASDPSQADKVAELRNLLSFGLLRK
jgi:uncharacterized protein involved in exopolysaccharide biosynthesis